MASNTPLSSPQSDRSSVDGADDASCRERRAYVTPRLETLGDIRDLTLGATLGVGDSTPMNTQPF